MFLACVARGLGGVLYRLHVALPRGVLVSTAIAPIVAGLGVLGDRTPRLAGLALLVVFGCLMAFLVSSARGRPDNPATSAGYQRDSSG